MEDRGYALSHEEHGEVLEGAMALQSRRSPIGGGTVGLLRLWSSPLCPPRARGRLLRAPREADGIVVGCVKRC